MPTIRSLPVPPRTAGLLAATLLLGALLSLTACATTPPPADSPLSGHWQIGPKAGDDVAAVVNRAIARAEAELRRRHRYQGASGTNAPGAGNGAGAEQSFDTAGDLLGNNLVIGPDFHELHDRLLEALGTPSKLTIAVTPGVVDIQRDGLPPREYRSGEVITRFDEYGTARLDSRWKGAAFEVQQRYTSGARLTERYELDASGALLYSRTLQDPTIGELDIKSVFNRLQAPGP